MSVAQEILSVTEITDRIKRSLAGQFGEVWVRGEISDLARAGSGHCYFALKDESARLSAVLWRTAASRLKFELEDGVEVICRGAIDVYPPRGSYQLAVREMMPVGLGPLQLAFQQLHTRLAAEGLFDPRHKKPIPRFPRRIVLITSSHGAAVRDFLQVLSRHWRLAEVLLVPVRVQGDGSAREIAAAIAAANRIRPPWDVIALVRGGGSAEDLWSFNEEIVCRAIHASRIPIVSGIGHEIDVTLADLVADVRALTPTEAAERIVPKQSEILSWLDESGQRLTAALRGRLDFARQRLDLIRSRPALHSPLEAIQMRGMRLDDLQVRLTNPILQRMERARHHCEQLSARFHSLNPLAVLQRGYSITTDAAGRVLRDTHQLEADTLVETRLAQGRIVSRVVTLE